MYLEGVDTYYPRLEKYELVQIAERVAKCYPCLNTPNITCLNCSCDTVGLMNSRNGYCKKATGFKVFKNQEEFDEFEKNFTYEFEYRVTPRNY